MINRSAVAGLQAGYLLLAIFDSFLECPNWVFIFKVYALSASTFIRLYYV